MNSNSPFHDSSLNGLPSIDDQGYAIDYPLASDLFKLTYEELHTLNVLVNNTIDLLSCNSESKEQVLLLENYISQYRKEGRLIYQLIHEYLPHLENQHNVVKKLTHLIHSADNLEETLQYFHQISDGLSKVLDFEFQHITFHSKIMT